MKKLRGVLVLLAALSAGACEDLADPNGVNDTYVLTAAQGDPLPAVIFDGETEFGHLVATALSGSLTLRDVTFTERVVVDLVLDGNPLPGDPIIVSGSYSADGQILNFEPDQAGSPDFSGTLQGGVLTTVEVDPEFGELTLRWEL